MNSDFAPAQTTYQMLLGGWYLDCFRSGKTDFFYQFPATLPVYRICHAGLFDPFAIMDETRVRFYTPCSILRSGNLNMLFQLSDYLRLIKYPVEDRLAATLINGYCRLMVQWFTDCTSVHLYKNVQELLFNMTISFNFKYKIIL